MTYTMLPHFCHLSYMSKLESKNRTRIRRLDPNIVSVSELENKLGKEVFFIHFLKIKRALDF